VRWNCTPSSKPGLVVVIIFPVFAGLALHPHSGGGWCFGGHLRDVPVDALMYSALLWPSFLAIDGLVVDETPLLSASITVGTAKKRAKGSRHQRRGNSSSQRWCDLQWCGVFRRWCSSTDIHGALVPRVAALVADRGADFGLCVAHAHAMMCASWKREEKHNWFTAQNGAVL
jgi:hypothetical protein